MILQKLVQQRESFLRNTDNFLALFIVFEWDRILESGMDKWEVKCNVKLCPYCFSVNVFVLAIVFRRQFLENRQLQAKLSFFLIYRRNTSAWYENVHRKTIRA